MLNLNRNLVTPGLWLEPLFSSLSCLHMRGHQVNGWHELSLLQFDNITKLQLSNNDLGPLMDGTFLPKTLRSLKLKLSRIEKMTNMSHLEHLGTLHIHRNKLTSLPDLSHLPLQDDGLMIERENCITLNPLLLNCSVRTWNTVYPKKYAHGFVVLCFVVVMQSFIMNSHEVFIHIHQGCFAGTVAIVRLPQCQWSKPDGYGKISQCITTTKHSKAKTVCIFLGIYCILTFHIIPFLAGTIRKKTQNILRIACSQYHDVIRDNDASDYYFTVNIMMWLGPMMQVNTISQSISWCDKGQWCKWILFHSQYHDVIRDNDASEYYFTVNIMMW